MGCYDIIGAVDIVTMEVWLVIYWRLSVVVWTVAQIYERSHAEMTSPQDYYAAVGAQSGPLTGADGGSPSAAAPAGVLRKQGLSRSLLLTFWEVPASFIGVVTWTWQHAEEQKMHRKWNYSMEIIWYGGLNGWSIRLATERS